ncbi:ATP-dependent DNA helicase RecG [Candidatus Viridilinea mediisalina]|uniref:ATP-dependent DNA helicase RecG n=1 Tax=Candidatus Viridilinea mediisalina TaxID=2024553 RepID=A0A2A6RMF1_9CHLR|nr:ATP-dependent DNA helicase RecG [Candidatus Viridilinea mediisalina]PDW04242.1 ATP-dependent DNA helicase RecG [Candidatus Viridilinea mediisalina]
MQYREPIITLGRVLAAEQRGGCKDQATAQGLDHFLADWQAAHGEALAEPAVRSALELLTDYRAQTLSARYTHIQRAITGLRALFRPAQQPTPSAALALEHEVAPRADAPSPPHTTQQADASPPPPKTRTRKPKTRTSAAPLDPKPAFDLELSDGLERVPGLSRTDINAFKRLGLRTVEDLLYHFPHRYDDFSQQQGIAHLVVGSSVTIVGEITDVQLRGGPRPRVEVVVSDESGSIKAVYFNQPWLMKQLTVGRMITLSGKVSTFNGLRQLTSPAWEPYMPDVESLHTGRLVPVHPLTKGLIERNARAAIKLVVDAVTPKVPDYLPAAVRTRRNLLPLGSALAQIHYPADAAQMQRARERLGFDEFLFIQLGVVQRKLLWQGELGYQLRFMPELHAELQQQLPFSLTAAQRRSLDEIFGDMAHPKPMARLLQGDVGSGKTVVAAAALLQAIGNGFQGALMAPTEILAEQHYKGLKQLLGRVAVPRSAAQASDENAWQAELDPEEAARLAEIKAILGMSEADDMEGKGVRVALLTGSLGARERRRVLEGIAKGDIDLVVGTHALITESVRFHALGLVVVDEQHRFGVEQRQRLRDKGFNPHLLVMTATPIPRTLTMTIYGDLDTSLLDELPPGRQAIRTRWVRKRERDKAYRHVRREVEKGRQVFVICPLVEESETLDLPSAEEMYEQLQGTIFPDLRVTLLHGRMLPREKDEVMVAFRERQYDILVATSVIEVGIDIPNASTIIIEGAERFGLAQLHQFRGRVGRGQHQSYCILISDKDDNEATKQRLEAMEASTDGFKLAEIDLNLRGPGEFFGTRQSGTPDLKIAGLTDTRLLHAAREEAVAILEADLQLAQAEHALLRQKVEAFWAEAAKAG